MLLVRSGSLRGTNEIRLYTFDAGCVAYLVRCGGSDQLVGYLGLVGTLVGDAVVGGGFVRVVREPTHCVIKVRRSGVVVVVVDGR